MGLYDQCAIRKHTQHQNNNVSVDIWVTNLLLTWSRLMASELGSALTLHATRSWAVELATCFADDINFSSVAWPWTSALAASHRLCVAAATSRAYIKVTVVNNTKGIYTKNIQLQYWNLHSRSHFLVNATYLQFPIKVWLSTAATELLNWFFQFQFHFWPKKGGAPLILWPWNLTYNLMTLFIKLNLDRGKMNLHAKWP